MNHNHVFIAVPKDDAGVDTPASVIFGTRKATEGKFKFINITCNDNHLKFEDLDDRPEVRWSADISGEDIDATLVEDFISNKDPESQGGDTSKLKCTELTTDEKSFKSNPLTTAMFFLLLSNFRFRQNTPVLGRTSGQEAIATVQTWHVATSYLDSKVTEDVVRESWKKESKKWYSEFKVVFKDETDPQTILTTKNAIIGSTALTAAGLGVGVVVHREKLQRLFKSGNSNEVATNPNKRTQQGGKGDVHGREALRAFLKDYERLTFHDACVTRRVNPTDLTVWANRSGIWSQVDISDLWGRRLKQSLCRALVMNMFGLSSAQYEAMRDNVNGSIALYRHKKRDHYAILLRLPTKTLR